MATQEQIDAVVDAVITEFDANPALWSVFLRRSKLVTELLALESEQRNLQAAEDEQNQAFSDAAVVKQAELTAKQAEIDAL